MEIVCFRLDEGVKRNLISYYSSIHHLKFIDDSEQLSAFLEQEGNHWVTLVASVKIQDSEILKLIAKAKKYQIPTIVLSDDYEVSVRSRYLQLGASLVLNNPSCDVEIVYSVMAVCNQYNSSYINDENFTVDLIHRKVWYKTSEISLTPQLFNLVVYFLNHRGKVLKRSEILESLFPESTSKERSVDTLIKKLRSITSTNIIETRHGVGYIYNSKAV